jgi:signal transduction histidine kinase
MLRRIRQIKLDRHISHPRFSPTSLQFRLTLELAIISIFGLGTISLWAGWQMEQALVSSHKHLLEYVATRFPEQVEMYAESGDINAGIKRTTDKLTTPDLSILVQDKNGDTIAKSAVDRAGSLDNVRIVATVKVPEMPEVVRFGDRYIVMCGGALKVKDRSVGKVYLMQDVTAEQDRLSGIVYTLAIGCTIAIAISIAAIYTRIRRAILPIERASELAGSISLEDLKTTKLELDNAPDEIQGLARSFNQMLLRLADASDRQRQFVGNVSHELRTPLTVIGGYLQSLLRRGDNLNAYQRQAIETASAETKRTVQMLQDLLDLARADSGNLHFRQQPVYLNTLIIEVAQMSERVSGRQIKLTALDRDVFALADRDRLQQVLINITDNAIKYSSDLIEIELDITHDRAIVSVSDRGIGIPLHHQQRIFERFYRADEASTRSRDGTGLGLAIAKSSIEGMHGSIGLRSKPDEGSTFTISLPLWKQPV